MDKRETSYVFVSFSEAHLTFFASCHLTWFDPETPSSQEPEPQHSGGRYDLKEKTVFTEVMLTCQYDPDGICGSDPYGWWSQVVWASEVGMAVELRPLLSLQLHRHGPQDEWRELLGTEVTGGYCKLL